jgi:hypothetical protein
MWRSMRSIHDENGQAMVYDGAIDNCMTRSATGTNDEGATSCPIHVDYENDGTTTPHAPLAMSYEVHDTNTC